MNKVMITTWMASLALVASLSATAQPAVTGAAPSVASHEISPAEDAVKTADIHQQSEGLIYSVNRTPERTFDVARAVDVVTGDEIRSRNWITLADLLEEEAGVSLTAGYAGGNAAVIRGLGGNQVMIMVDGVKVNQANWPPTAIKDELNMIDTSIIERIEIVRGVVSVLGTEALGGVINVITRRGPDVPTRFGGIIGTRVSSGDRSVAVPQLFGQSEKLRYRPAGRTSMPATGVAERTSEHSAPRRSHRHPVPLLSLCR